ncbi:hypothetical protein SAMN05216371_8281 [Streptomyces sp. TLI_053]|uniref:hypothetical protein n=1 Tax=Streptomyces sp. TLI_053 TaxID=1855352 RepID=UPI000879FB71|nr:hypothetical protein [Streptomyces sp. TLI_053]SDT83450.1 hypothetical protein SAMN05216371_8281 [Streptomyces sp. TLI_053]
MRWPWQRAARTTTCPSPCQLPSAEAGVPFEATLTLLWRPTTRDRANLEEQARSDLRCAAADVTAGLLPDDLPTAQDTLNMALGAPDRQRSPHYRLLSAHVTLRLSTTAQETLAARRADTERIRRLEFLKRALYDHPDLVVLDHIERASEIPDDARVAELQRAARAIRSCNTWWYPLLELWEELGAGFQDLDTRHEAMQILLRQSVEALKAATTPPSRATAQHGRTG